MKKLHHNTSSHKHLLEAILAWPLLRGECSLLSLLSKIRILTWFFISPILHDNVVLQRYFKVDFTLNYLAKSQTYWFEAMYIFLCFHELVMHLKFSEPQFPFWKMGKLYLEEVWKSTMIIWLKYNEYSVFLALVIYTKVIKIITERIQVLVLNSFESFIFALFAIWPWANT